MSDVWWTNSDVGLDAMDSAIRSVCSNLFVSLMQLLIGNGCKMESLFLVPERHRRGAGRRLVRHALALHGELTVDVNEQNAAACRFYEACRFVVERRSELDEQGRPHPLLHMRFDRAQRAATADQAGLTAF